MKVMRLALGSVGIIALLSCVAAAQDVETVVVTGRTLPMDKVVQLDKTGTPLADVPRSIEVIPSSLFNTQGDTKLSQTLVDVSGLSQGGQYNFGFFDRIIIRGLNATFLNDGLPESTSDLTGFVHSLTGVESVEVLKGPGSALYGSAEEGGTINLVHYRPSDIASEFLSEQYGSFDTTTTDASATGPTGIANLDWRLDGEFQHSDGFRNLTNQTGELYGALSYRPTNHDVELRFEYHNLRNIPDAEGIPFSPPGGIGDPLAVPSNFEYYTPYAFANQQIERVFLSDAWTWNSDLVINLRAAYSNRDVDLARNSGGSVTLAGAFYELAKRQLREQNDHVGDLTLQAEPTWTFDTGGLKHVLVTGAEFRNIDANTERATADLPNIANIYDPVVNDGTLAGLTFQCNASHSCDNARLLGKFYGIYAVDQIDVTDSLKIRLTAREDWFETEAQARTANVPANPGQEEPCVPPSAMVCPLLPGAPAIQSDSLFSWDEGLVYFLTPDLSAFGGVSSAAYPIFNTEEPESVGQTPETGTQYEAGLRFQQAAWLSASSSVYSATRDNVFTLFNDLPTVFSYRVEGWETDVNVRPTEGWNIVANFTAQSPVITNYPQTPVDVGRAVPSVPSVLANLWTSYDIPVTGWTDLPELSFGVRYRDHEWADAGNTRFLPGVPLFDMQLGIPHDQWEFQIGVSNILNRQNYITAAGTGGGAMPGPDRTYFVKLSYKPQ
jgi:iron complex outermembrane recepter protein